MKLRLKHCGVLRGFEPIDVRLLQQLVEKAVSLHGIALHFSQKNQRSTRVWALPLGLISVLCPTDVYVCPSATTTLSRLPQPFSEALMAGWVLSPYTPLSRLSQQF